MVTLVENIPEVLWRDNKKYMWDGAVYDDRALAEEKEKSYRANRFETILQPAGDKFALYSRRVAEAVVEGG